MNSQRLTSLLEEMTLDEKIAQLLQLATPFFEGSKDEGQITGPLASMNILDENVRNTGSVLGASGGAKRSYNYTASPPEKESTRHSPLIYGGCHPRI